MKQLKLYEGLESSPELDRPYIDPDIPEKEFYLPERLDLMVTGRCILRCAGCWGPTHNSTEPEMSAEQWRKIVSYVDMNNRSDRFSSSLMASDPAQVCITGGEPLMYDQLPELVQGLHEDRTPTTLSTTGYDPDGLLPEILPYIQELGVPIDGSVPATNSLWRKGKLADGGLNDALEAIVLAQADYPDVRITMRTLVHNDNFPDIPNIPSFLTDSGVDTSKINWKFYLHNSNTGPRQTGSELRPGQDNLNWLADRIAELEDDFASLNTLMPAMPQDRLVISHSGEAYVVLPDSDNRTLDITIGNVLTAPTEAIRYLNSNYPNFLIRACRRAGNLKYLELVEAYGDESDPVRAAEYELFRLINGVRA